MPKVKRPLKILFFAPREWRTIIMRRIEHAEFTPIFADDGDIDLGRFDAVAPLDLDDYDRLRGIPEIARKAIVPGAEAVELANDKLRMDLALQERGFGSLRPGLHNRKGPQYPYIAKARYGRSGAEAHIIESAEDEAEFCDFLEREDVFAQEYIPGSDEFCAHFLIHEGQIGFHTTIRHSMAREGLVKGVRNFPLRSIPLPGADPYHGEFSRLLLAIGYQGPVCIDYKIAQDGPKIMEINPRYGVSLLNAINEWLDVYVAMLGLAPKPGPYQRWMLRHRRVYARRVRQLLGRNELEPMTGTGHHP